MDKNRFCSIYYEDDIFEPIKSLDKDTTALLVIDLQNTYLKLGRDLENQKDAKFKDFAKRLDNIVLPNVKKLQDAFREKSIPVIFCRIACHLKNGKDRSLSQKLPGWNNVLLPKDEYDSQIISSIAPIDDEIVVTKTTDSALTGTNLRLILNNLGIKTVVCVGIFTDQCVASTVRSLSDESFNVLVCEDACAAGSIALHEAELTIINHIYCSVTSTDKILSLI